MNTVLARWNRITTWASRNGGLVLLGLALTTLSAHQGTGIPSAFFAVLFMLAAGVLLPLENRTHVSLLGVSGLLVTSVAISVAVHPTPGLIAVMGLPFLALGYSMSLGYRLGAHQRNAAIGLVLGLSLLCAAWGLPDRWNHVRPYEAWFNDYNSAATLFNLGVFAALALAADSRGMARRVFAGLALLLMAAVVYSASRGGLLTLMFGLALVALHSRAALGAQVRSHKRLLIPGAILGLAAVSYMAYTTGMVDRMTRLGSDESTFARWSMWVAGWHMVQDGNWLTGYGLGMWMHLYPAYRSAADFESAGFMAHNDYVQTLVEGGPLLVSALVSVAALSLWAALSKHSPRRSAALAAGVALVSLHATFNFPFYNVQLTLALGLVLGLALADNTALKSIPGKLAMKWTTAQWLCLAVAVPVLFWIALESVTGKAAFSSGSWPSRLIPNAGKVEVVSALFGENGDRAFSAEPRKTLATHYLGMGVGKTEDSLEVRRATLNKAIALYASATAPVPGAYVPAQTHLMFRGIEAGVFDKATTVPRIKALLAPLIKRYPNKTDLRMSWADAILLDEGYPAALAYVEAEQKTLTTMEFERKAKYWKRTRNPAASNVSAAEVLESGTGTH